MEKCRLDFNKYRERFKEIYPTLSEKERKKIFYLRVWFWEVIVENYESFNIN